MPKRPLVSVILPVYNGTATVAAALHSSLTQTCTALEVIVVDDGSTDTTAAQLRQCADPRVRLIAQAHQGAAAARNHGVLLARAPYLAFLDADDLWLPAKLAVQLAALAAAPEVDMVFGHYEEFEDGGAGVRPAAPGYSSGTLLVRRAAFFKVGLFATTWRVGEFIDWYARALEAGLTSALRPEVVLRRRVHAHNSTRAGRQDYAAVLAAMVRRRRAAAGAAP